VHNILWEGPEIQHYFRGADFSGRANIEKEQNFRRLGNFT
jgi:hypothetical protein